ncbi:hypothetical protein [Methanohalobium evestigatum]|uniref:hypothetical protein n=1 Tax=Methanohalobium evestigatum TaxID=2322 RepID=UPI000677BED7|nr:hypothetical protein [Methanohalobium evestigatum]
MTGLDLALTENNLAAGVPLFLTALVILPPPAGITNIIESKINYKIPGGLKLAIGTILLFIAWINLPASV